MKPVLEVEGIHKYYQDKKLFGKEQSVVKAVNGVSFSLNKGEAFGLVGESGCGKSTTGKVIAQLIKQTSGVVRFQGQDLAELSAKQLKAWRKQVQIVFQDPYSSLNPKKTLEWILEEPLIIHKLGDKTWRRKRVIQVLADVGLDASFLKRYPHELSGGQRQRIAIAAALVLKPELIVIDEGVSALDVSVQAQILNLLKKLQHKYDLTYIFISHDLNVVQYFCDRIAVMYLGEIVETGTTEDIGDQPKHPYSQALFSAKPTMEGTTDRIILKGDMPDPAHAPAGCPFHTRCPLAMEQCGHVKPERVQMAGMHHVSCHLYEEGDMSHENRRCI
ncbi:ABC transporter ATP-binding protein [Lentibacillus saliphilus]|uniref:ABC transporter ATP-binding protein n=1 Tax=Lentibacillus saliphilus TaxID=2737028 RepID=UPI001C30E01C|nr:oligopeptide/dipeptide ABC transporter ATP-binding protein [Lentibacillus saliphilus]